ncbi:MAG: hypothetical protein DSY89_07400, partial [Deltaproteobacteria bacterium]
KKEKIAKSIQTKKIVIVAGSNALFGIKSKMLSKALHMPVLNYGVNAGIELPLTLELAKRTSQTPGEFIFVNLIDFDMLYGHRRNPQGYADALEKTDGFMAKLLPLIRNDDILIITADHGNSETMVDENGQPHTAHTLNPVRLILVDDSRKNVHLAEGALCDIAPTILDILGIQPPEEMTGHSLIIDEQS